MRILLAAIFYLFCLQAHAGFTLGTGGATDATGWSTFTAKTVTSGSCSAGTADGTCAIYIDSAAPGGVCALTTVGDLTHRCQTYIAAISAYGSRNNKPDWFLFKEGDSQNNVIISADGVTCCFNKNGLDATNLLVFGSYDSASPSTVSPATGGNRPILNTPSNGEGVLKCQGGSGQGCSYLAIVNLDFYPKDCDPKVTGRQANCSISFGFQNINPTPFVLLEGNKWSYYGNVGNVLPQAGDNSTNSTGHLYIRRNTLVDAFGQGLDVISGGTFLFEENVIDHNGYVIVSTSGTITNTVTNSTPAVVSWANAMGQSGTTQVRFTSSGGGITAGTLYNAVNNDFSTFKLATTVNTQTVKTNSSTTITGIDVSSVSVGDGIDGTTIPTGSTVSSIASNFSVSGNTHTTGTVDGIASTTGIFVGSNVSSSDTACASSQPTIASGTTVTGVAANSITINPPACATVSSLSIAVTPNKIVINNAATDTASHTVSTFHQADLITKNTGIVSPQTITWTLFGPDGRLHNVYFASGSNAGTPMAPVTIRYNTMTQDPASIQWRPGGTMQYNAFIANAISHNIGMMSGTDTLIDHNIYLAGKDWGLGGGSEAFETMAPNYQGDPTFGTFTGGPKAITITNNIFANTIDPAPSANAMKQGFTVSHGSNIVYNHNSPSMFTFAGAGGIQFGTVTTGGSGFTDSTLAFSSIINDPSNPSTNQATLVVASTVGFIGATSGWITGVTGGGSCALNNVPLKFYGYDSTHILTSVTFAAASGCSGGGTIYMQSFIKTGNTHTSTTIDGISSTTGIFPGAIIGCALNSAGCMDNGVDPFALHVVSIPTANSITLDAPTPSSQTGVVLEITNIANFATDASCVGCAGTGASTGYVSVSGALVYMAIYGNDSFSAGINPGPGIGYKVGDKLKITGFGGSGSVYTVGAVSTLTDLGGDKFNPGTGNTTYSFPGCAAPSAGTSPLNCTAAKYYDFITNTAGHTDLDFINAARGNQKANWNPLLVANTGLVPWIQAGFGIGKFLGTTNP